MGPVPGADCYLPGVLSVTDDGVRLHRSGTSIPLADPDGRCDRSLDGQRRTVGFDVDGFGTVPVEDGDPGVTVEDGRIVLLGRPTRYDSTWDRPRTIRYDLTFDPGRWPITLDDAQDPSEDFYVTAPPLDSRTLPHRLRIDVDRLRVVEVLPRSADPYAGPLEEIAIEVYLDTETIATVEAGDVDADTIGPNRALAPLVDVRLTAGDAPLWVDHGWVSGTGKKFLEVLGQSLETVLEGEAVDFYPPELPAFALTMQPRGDTVDVDFYAVNAVIGVQPRGPLEVDREELLRAYCRATCSYLDTLLYYSPREQRVREEHEPLFALLAEVAESCGFEYDPGTLGRGQWLYDATGAVTPATSVDRLRDLVRTEPPARRAAVEALARREVADAAPLLADQLRTGSLRATTRWRIVEALGRFGDPVALGALLETLHADPQQDLREAAIADDPGSGPPPVDAPGNGWAGATLLGALVTEPKRSLRADLAALLESLAPDRARELHVEELVPVDDEATRLALLRLFGHETGSRRSVILDGLAASDATTRRAAALGARVLAADPPFESLAARFDDTEIGVRIASTASFVGLVEASEADPPVGPLLEALDDPSPTVRANALDALAPVAEADTSGDVGGVDPAEVVGTLVEALDDESSSVGRRVPPILADLRREDAVDALFEALDRDLPDRVTAAVARAIADLEDPRVGPTMRESLGADHWAVRDVAVEYLGANPEVIRLADLEGTDADTLSLVSSILEHAERRDRSGIRDRAREYLVDVLDEDSERARRNAVEALGTASGAPDVREHVRSVALNDPHPDVRRAALDRVSLWDDDQARSVLLAATTAAEPATRALACRLLYRLSGDPTAEMLDALADRTGDPDRGVRSSAVEGLADTARHSGDPDRVAETVDVLGRLARDDGDESVRRHAVTGLERVARNDLVETTAVVDPLAGALRTDESIGVREAAVDALEAIGTTRARAALERAAREDPSAKLRDRAGDAAADVDP